MDEDGRSGRLRSFVLGGLVGASAAIAAARRLAPRPYRRRQPPAGLAAFTAAPCYRETLDQEDGAAPR